MCRLWGAAGVGGKPRRVDVVLSLGYGVSSPGPLGLLLLVPPVSPLSKHAALCFVFLPHPSLSSSSPRLPLLRFRPPSRPLPCLPAAPHPLTRRLSSESHLCPRSASASPLHPPRVPLRSRSTDRKGPPSSPTSDGAPEGAQVRLCTLPTPLSASSPFYKRVGHLGCPVS